MLRKIKHVQLDGILQHNAQVVNNVFQANSFSNSPGVSLGDLERSGEKLTVGP
jgi:hypothetical protein